MTERIEAKIGEIIECILSKDAKDITYSEYQTLEARLSSLRLEELYKNNSLLTSCSCATKSEMEDYRHE